MTAVRMQFFLLAVVILEGLWLTGFGQVHRFSWVPVVLLIIAGATGIRPGMMIWQKLGFK